MCCHLRSGVKFTDKFNTIAVFCCGQLADATIARPEMWSQSIEY